MWYPVILNLNKDNMGAEPENAQVIIDFEHEVQRLKLITIKLENLVKKARIIGFNL